MRSISCQSLSSPLLLSEHRHRHQIPTTSKSFVPHGNGNGNVNGSSSSSLRTRAGALPSPVFLAAASPPAGKLSVVLQTSAVCLIAYWVANFVVPEFILKDLRSKETNEDGENPGEDER